MWHTCIIPSVTVATLPWLHTNGGVGEGLSETNGVGRGDEDSPIVVGSVVVVGIVVVWVVVVVVGIVVVGIVVETGTVEVAMIEDVTNCESRKEQNRIDSNKLYEQMSYYCTQLT